MPIKTLVGASVAALLSLLGGCAPQSSVPPPPAVRQVSAPLQEPFRSALARWNYYRSSVGVPAIEADPVLNDAALHHAKYLVKNHISAGDAVLGQGRIIETGWNASAHAESVGNQWYTEDGAKWADYATVIRGHSPISDGTGLVDEQAARGDSLAVLDPQLAAVGFGLFCEADDCAGLIVYKRGLTKSQFLALYEGNAMDWNGMLGAMPFTIARLRKPIEFPPTTIQFPLRAYRGGEYADALANCHGYSVPSGVMIVLELGAPSEGEDVKLASNSLTENGVEVETCGFDATSYANPDGFQQTWARQTLHAYGAVVVVPKNPLDAGHSYTVSMVADSQPYTWSFSVAPDAK